MNTAIDAPAGTAHGSEVTAVRDLTVLAYWLSLGAAAGGLGGALVGGVGGRFAMYLLRLTSADWVRGLKSDDGFTIGRFDLSDTMQLVAVTTVMGNLVGFIMVFGRPFFPRRGMPVAWGVAGALLGGGLFIHTDGVDFTLLGPRWFAILLFVLLPAAGALTIAALIEFYHRFWWRRRGLTAVASVAAIPSLIVFPIGLGAIAVAAACFAALRLPQGRMFPDWLPARVAALGVFVALTAGGTVALAWKVQKLL